MTTSNTPRYISLIDSSSASDIKAALVSLCSESTRNATRTIELLQELKVVRNRNRAVATAGSATSGAPARGTRRRASTELARCADCGEIFEPEKESWRQEEDGIRGTCLYHSGEMEVDWDAWEDHDERCHGKIDTKSNRRDFPENFIWDCCDKSGDEVGCRRGYHTVTKKEEWDGSTDEEEG